MEWRGDGGAELSQGLPASHFKHRALLLGSGKDL